ncbi:MAG: sialate O-acetylesterase [Verrucomicrobiota bacterium]
MSNIDDALKAIKDDYEIAGMLWMQGETDTIRNNMAEGYRKNLEELISIMRERFKKPEMPVVIGRITTELLKSKKYKWPFTTTVQAAQDAVGENDPHAYTIHSDDLSLRPDFTHFDVPGQMELGRRFGRAMLKGMKL